MRVELLSGSATILQRWESALKKLSPVRTDEIEQEGEKRVTVVDYDTAASQVRAYLKENTDPAVRLVVLEGVPDIERGKSLLAAGIKGYGNAYMASEWLRVCVETVMAGNIWLYPEFVSAMVVELAGADDACASLPDFLTPRQKELVQLLLKGLSNKEIARRLGIKERTVKAHMAGIYEKFGVSNRFELAVRLRNS